MKRLGLVSILVLAVFALFVTCGDPDGGKGYTYTVTFDNNGGDTEAEPQTIKVNSPATTIDALPTAPTRANHSFAGWNTESDGSGTDFTAETPVTADITVYAQWELALEEGTFAIKFDLTGTVADGDSVTASPEFGKAGDKITIDYTLANDKLNNRLVFSGITESIEEVDVAGTGTREYTIDEEDADLDGTITIIAVFTHTNKNLDTIEFEESVVSKTYGAAPFTITVKEEGNGSGDITYSVHADHAGIVTVSSTGEVTILKVGTGVRIIATKEADDIYEETEAFYTLHITQLQLTIGAPTGTPTKIYDGNTTATGITAGSLTNKVGDDDVAAVVASATYDTADAGDSKTVTVTYSISGADAGNYTAPASSTITGSITKATGGAVSAPTAAEKAHSHITVNAVTASNGQPVEYGISTSNTTEPTSWQDGLTFSGLDEETDYYVFARAKANNNYNAGTAVASEKITTLKEPEAGATLTGTVTVYLLRHNSVRISTVAAPGNNQTVEYAVSTESTAPISGWQDGKDITGLTPETAYYAYARAKANSDYYAGTAISSSATFTTKAAPTPPYNNTAPIVVDFEEDITLNTAKSSSGSSPTLTRVADPDNSGEQSLQIASTDWNQAAIVPIHLDYALQNYRSFTFRFMQKSGTSTNSISVYVSNATSSFANGGFGNGWTSTNTKFPQFLLGEITGYATTAKTDQWVDYEIIIPNLNNPDSGNANEVTNFNTIKNLQGDIYLAIGINQNGNLSNLFDDLTFNLNSYLNSSITPTTATYFKDEATDIDVTVVFNGNNLVIRNEGTPLTQGTDYNVTDNGVKLLSSYLGDQEEGPLTLTFDFDNGADSEIVITIMATRPATVLSYNFTTDPGTVTWRFAPTIPTNATIAWNAPGTTIGGVTTGGLLVNDTSGYSGQFLVLPFNLGSENLSQYTSITFTFYRVSGENAGTGKSVRINVKNANAVTNNLEFSGNAGTNNVVINSSDNNGQNMEIKANGTLSEFTFTINEAKKASIGHLTGPIEIGFYFNTGTLEYLLQTVTLNK